MKLDRKIGGLCAALTMAAAGNVLAQVPVGHEPTEAIPPAPQRTDVPQAPTRWTPLSGFGMTLAGGAGVTSFTQSGARGVTDTGASWAVRMAFESRRLLGFEFSYIGGANPIRSLGLDSNTMLVRNGIEGALRLNAPIYVKDTLLEPYIAGGVGWNSYHVTNLQTTTASVSPASHNALSVPLAFGFLVGYRGFIADARYTIRPTYNQTTLENDGSGALTNWDVGGMVGYEF